MQVEFDKSFHKRILLIHDKQLLLKIKETIIEVENAQKLSDIGNLKKLKGFKEFYRIRIGNHRIGIEITKDCVRFITIASRQEIYKLFP